MYYTQKHPLAATSTTWDELMQMAVVEILNLEPTPLTLPRFRWNEKTLQALDARPTTWAHLGVLPVVGEEDLVADILQKWQWISTGLYLAKQLHT